MGAFSPSNPDELVCPECGWGEFYDIETYPRDVILGNAYKLAHSNLSWVYRQLAREITNAFNFLEEQELNERTTQ